MFKRNTNRGRSTLDKDKNYSRQMLEKYKNLIRDKRNNEDSTTIERYYQLVEHFQRLHNSAMQKIENQFNQQKKNTSNKEENRNQKTGKASEVEIKLINDKPIIHKDETLPTKTKATGIAPAKKTSKNGNSTNDKSSNEENSKKITAKTSTSPQQNKNLQIKKPSTTND